MPKRKIQIPSPVRFVDPITGVTSEDVITFRTFLERVFQNPLWNESVKHAMAQQSVATLAHQAEDAKADHMVIAESDWEYLDACARTPKTFLPNGQVITGFGNMPQLARIFLPFQQAIIGAEQVP